MAYLKYTVNNHQGVYDMRAFSVQENYVPNNSKIERYLAELDAERVPKAVSTPVSQIHAAGMPILDKIANGVSSFFENLTEKLDNRNRLTMK